MEVKSGVSSSFICQLHLCPLLCASGGQWEKATEVFEQMNSQGCTPDVVTYTSLISSYERGGQWQKALQAFHKMCLQGCKPDAIVYNAIIDTLWETGVIWAQNKAFQLFVSALQQGQFMQVGGLLGLFYTFADGGYIHQESWDWVGWRSRDCRECSRG